jgi:hypothetical protein
LAKETKPKIEPEKQQPTVTIKDEDDWGDEWGDIEP